MKWTTQQQKTIDERGSNILVSAAAGSGKTAVLVERIEKMVTEDKVPIDRMLIVTFTNAAASEMREKIRKALKAGVRENPEMKKQLELMPRASISTFHAFALDVIRHFFYLIDMEPDFSICDEAQSMVLSEEALDQLMEECFDAGDSEFYQFLDWYGSERGNDTIRDMIKSVHKSLMALPEPFDTLEEKIRELELSPAEYEKTDAMAFVKADVTARLTRAVDAVTRAYGLIMDEGLTNLGNTFRADVDMCQNLLSMAKLSMNADLVQAVSQVSWSRLGARGEEKAAYDMIKGRVTGLRDQAKSIIGALSESYLCDSLDSQLSELALVAPKARTLQKLIVRYHEIFINKKKEKKLVDFNDIEHDCLAILKNPGASEFYKEKFQYIFIDEYQDTSMLQEAIIERIKSEANLFMVGDIKQSIYKFRLAEPEIFKAKYDSFADCEDGLSTKIDLNRNFRSKPVILEEINNIFEPIMEGYDDNARLYPGLEYDGELSFEPETKIVDVASLEDADEALQDLKNNELEAMEVCRLIKENLGTPYFDGKSGQIKNLQYRDMVILMRAVAGTAETYYEIMKEQGIPLHIDDNRGYFDTMEINVFMNLLSIIDNKFQDVEFISVLRSEIFGFSTDDLARVRVEFPEDSYVEAFINYGKEGQLSDLREMCSHVLETLKVWKTLSIAMPLPKFLWKLMLDTGYYIIMGTMPDGSLRQANLRALIDKTEAFSEGGQSSLYSFIKYIDTVKKNKVDMSQVKLLGENDDVVRMMTIHKSKGLEFPMVIVSGMGKNLRYTNSTGKVAFHKDVGLGLYLENPDDHFEKITLPYKIIMSKVRREEEEENLRVLYVALTRAREKLFLTAAIKDAEKFLIERENGITGTSNYLKMLTELPKCEIVDCSQLEAADKASVMGRRGGSQVLPGTVDEKTYEEVQRRLEYQYPFAAARKIRPKESVSALNKANHDEIHVSGGDQPSELHLEKPKFLQGERTLTRAEKGTVYHGIMERADFSRAQKEGLEYIRRLTEDLVERGVFLENEIEAIDLGRIVKFFESPMGKRCVDAFEKGTLYREQPFNLKLDVEGEDVIVQGIVDCFFEEDDGLVLLDYKSNWIDGDKDFAEEEARLKALYGKQMEIYGRALGAGIGKPVKESYLYLFAAGRLIEVNE